MYIDSYLFLFFFFNDTATTEIYTLSLHDALPISRASSRLRPNPARGRDGLLACDVQPLPALPVLQVPVACLRPCILEEVAAVARQGARERRRVLRLGERRSCRPQLGLELQAVELHRQARVDPVTFLLEHDPLGPAQGAAQLVQRDVEIVL